MFHKISTLCAVACLFAFSAAAQNPVVQPTPPIEQEDVVRITTELVQIDAIVTDKNDNQITNLTTADFEIYQDGKLQKIMGFSYVDIQTSVKTSEVVKQERIDDNKVITAPFSQAPVAVSRVITFIVDDGSCTASQTGMLASRETLEKFVEEQMLPTDSVAIYQTRGGKSLFRRYTSDKAQLLGIIRQIRWQPPLGSCGGNNGDIFEAARSESNLRSGRSQGTFENGTDRMRRQAAEDFIRDDQTIGGIEIMRYVVGNLRQLSGRKIVFFMSDGIPLRGRNGKTLRAREALRNLTEEANRSSVTFNTIDVRGNINVTAIESRDGIDPEPASRGRRTEMVIADRTAEVRNTQDGLLFLAEETGGNFFQGSNSVENHLRRVLKTEKGYYLIAYEPEGETFKDKKFHKIEVRLKRSGLRVLSRSGFIAQTEEETKANQSNKDSNIYRALAAPFPKTELKLQARAFFHNTVNQGNVVRLIARLDARDIIFTDEPDGNKKAVLDTVIIALDENNGVASDLNRTNTIRLSPQNAALLLEKGLSYSVDVPVKEAGTYNFRVAMRDAANGRIGTASQTVKVPDLKNGKLFLSVLTAVSLDKNGTPVSPSLPKLENTSTAASGTASKIYQFPKGSILTYAYTIYNARLDETTKQPKLTIETRLYRNGQLISQSEPQQAQLEPQTDPDRNNGLGYLQFKPEMKSGDYVMQIIVKDATTNEVFSQWIDFEVMG